MVSALVATSAGSTPFSSAKDMVGGVGGGGFGSPPPLAPPPPLVLAAGAAAPPPKGQMSAPDPEVSFPEP